MIDPIATFKEEAAEHLISLEEVLLELDGHPERVDLIDSAFRSIHTIKGSGAMFGFDALVQFTHHLETALDEVRKGVLPISQDLISIVFESLDHIQLLLNELKPSPEQREVGTGLLAKLHQLTGDSAQTAVLSALSGGNHVAHSGSIEGKVQQAVNSWRICFTPSQSSLTDGFDVRPVMRELQTLGACQVRCKSDALPLLQELEPEQCYLSFEVLLQGAASQDDLHDVFMFVAEEWTISIQSESDRVEQSTPSFALAAPVELPKATSRVESSNKIASLSVQDDAVLPKGEKGNSNHDVSVRVPARKLDVLMDLVGELVITQARMSQISQDFEDERIASIAEELERLTTHLRDNTFEIRMLPIGTTFSRFKRLVRDLSKELGKDIRLLTEGADTELDKMVIDSLADPLVHLIRNSVDHGIESAVVRQQAGKPAQGTIRLSARHADSSVLVTIEDDGAGLNAEKIYQKAVERQIISPGQILSEKECHQLIFEPGFSTAATVSDISGRGVGMDVVKRSIQDLRGEVQLSSQVGRGTCITIRLPMTLAIIEGLIVALGDELYVFPLSHVEECVELKQAEIQKQSDRAVDLIPIRGELVPYLRLREWFECSGEIPEIEQIVIVRHEQSIYGFSVDEIVGQQQVVIKNLGGACRGQTNFAGATITGDGGVAMIIDVDQTIKEFERLTQLKHPQANETVMA